MEHNGQAGSGVSGTRFVHDYSDKLDSTTGIRPFREAATPYLSGISRRSPAATLMLGDILHVQMVATRC